MAITGHGPTPPVGGPNYNSRRVSPNECYMKARHRLLFWLLLIHAPAVPPTSGTRYMSRLIGLLTSHSEGHVTRELFGADLIILKCSSDNKNDTRVEILSPKCCARQTGSVFP
ncbi:hypothetical protein AVEN_144606-1 [Araneus ventricosus]|uniref:Uncharacterized protein n=1 Tax=Araneus ventricosus TaxID=182803 RepID=A0A4Y2C1C1_ARAVE|nr:hypothetical protein AVEN_144606-1 [Araneus ventricosus]